MRTPRPLPSGGLGYFVIVGSMAVVKYLKRVLGSFDKVELSKREKVCLIPSSRTWSIAPLYSGTNFTLPSILWQCCETRAFSSGVTKAERMMV